MEKCPEWEQMQGQTLQPDPTWQILNMNKKCQSNIRALTWAKTFFFFDACERGKAGSRCLGNKGLSNSSAVWVHKKLPDIPYDSQNKGSGIQKTRNTLFCLEFVCLFNWISQKSKSSDWESFSLMSCLVLDTEEDQTQNGTRLQCWNAPVQVHS